MFVFVLNTCRAHFRQLRGWQWISLDSQFVAQVRHKHVDNNYQEVQCADTSGFRFNVQAFFFFWLVSFGLHNSRNIISHPAFLGAFTKLRKATVASSYPSVLIQLLGSHLTDFDKTWYLSLFRKYVGKIQVSLKSDETDAYFIWRRFQMYGSVSLNFS